MLPATSTTVRGGGGEEEEVEKRMGEEGEREGERAQKRGKEREGVRGRVNSTFTGVQNPSLVCYIASTQPQPSVLQCWPLLYLLCTNQVSLEGRRI